MWTVPKWEKKNLQKCDEWAQIRTKQKEKARPYTLVELVSIALQNNPSTKQALHSAKSSHMQFKQAEALWFPDVTASGNFTRSKQFANEKANDENLRSYGGSAKATLLLFDFGGREASVREARENVLASIFQFNQSIQDLFLEVCTAYYELYSAESSLDAAKDDVEDAKSAYYAAEQKFEAGVVAKLDVLQAKSNYDQKLFNLEEAKGNVKITKGNLANMIGMPADFDVEIKPPHHEIPAGITEKDISIVIEEAIKMRPDIAASRSGYKAKKEAILKTGSQLLPSLSAVGTAGKDWYEYFGDSKSFLHDHDYSAYLSVEWNVFDGFSNYAKWKQAIFDAKAEKEKLISAELNASNEVWEKYYAYKTASKKLVFSKTLLETAEESYDLAFESYTAGLKSILDLLQSQSQLSDARSKMIQSRKDLFVALAELAHSTGTIYIKGEKSEISGE